MARITPKIKKDVEDFINSSYKEIVTIITPDLLDKKTILKHKPAHIVEEDWIQNCRWILHSIIQQSIFKEYNNKSGGYVPLYSKALEQNIGKNHKLIGTARIIPV